MERNGEKQLANLLTAHFKEQGTLSYLENNIDCDVEELLNQLEGNDVRKRHDIQHGYLQVELKSCHSLLDPPGSGMQCSMLFEGTRHVTPTCMAHNEEVVFDTTCIFPLFPRGDLLQCNTPLHIVLLKTADQHLYKLCEAFVEWRTVLSTGSATITADLTSSAISIPTGVVVLDIKFFPKAGCILYAPHEVEQQLCGEKEQQGRSQVGLSRYLRDWYKTSSLDLNAHPLSQLTDGPPTSLPVTSFITRMTCKDLPTPLAAARYVSLFRHEDRTTLSITGDVKPRDVWASMHVVVATRAANVSERCCLLCCLLLGFSIDAWVAAGVMSEKKFMCVLTRDGESVTCWDAELGTSYAYGKQGAFTVHQVFNDTRCLFNQQLASGFTSFSFDEPELWKPFEWDFPTANMVRSLTTLRVLHNGINEEELEERLVTNIRGCRAGLGLRGRVMREGGLYEVMGQALWQYEMAAVTNMQTGGEALFRAACYSQVPKRYSLKFIPTHHTCAHLPSIMSSLMEHRDTRELVETHNRDTSITVRCKITEYPEGVTSTWVSIAVLHHNID